MRRYKTPEQLKQWRKDNHGLTHIGQYPGAYGLSLEESLRILEWMESRKKAGYSYDEVTRNEFLHKAAA